MRKSCLLVLGVLIFFISLTQVPILAEAHATESGGFPIPIEVTNRNLLPYLRGPELGLFAQTCHDHHTLASDELAQKARQALSDLVSPLVKLERGTFLMGPDQREGSNYNEKQFPAEIDHDYYMAVTPVSQEQFERIMGSDLNFSDHKGPNLPITNMSERDESEYLRRLNTRVAELWNAAYSNSTPPPQFRKPTEAEWEYATTLPLSQPEMVEIASPPEDRHSVPGEYHPQNRMFQITAKHQRFSGTNSEEQLRRYAVVQEPRERGPSNIDAMEPNARGIKGLSGNIDEATSTPYCRNPAVSRPTYFTAFRVRRGGKWCDEIKYCRSSARQPYVPCVGSVYLGLRLVADSPLP